jgi:hypothetical protein
MMTEDNMEDTWYRVFYDYDNTPHYTNRFPTKDGMFPSWGCIIPIINKTTTNYMLLLFSPRKIYLKRSDNTWTPVNYGYGDLWVYQSLETQPAQEFSNKDLLFFD